MPLDSYGQIDWIVMDSYSNWIVSIDSFHMFSWSFEDDSNIFPADFQAEVEEMFEVLEASGPSTST